MAAHGSCWSRRSLSWLVDSPQVHWIDSEVDWTTACERIASRLDHMLLPLPLQWYFQEVKQVKSWKWSLHMQLASMHLYCINSVCPLTASAVSRWKQHRCCCCFGFCAFPQMADLYLLSLLPVQSVACWPNVLCSTQPTKCWRKSPTKTFLGGFSKIICFKVLISCTNHLCFETSLQENRVFSIKLCSKIVFP